MSLFNGLYLYEVVLLILGVVLFLVLVFSFAVLVMKGRPYGKLLSFFILPIVMIGYPSIQSIAFGNDIITLTKLTHSLEDNPTDNKQRMMVEKKLAEVSGRSVVNAESNIELARAELALGNEKAAIEKIDKVLSSAPQQRAANELKKQIDLKHELGELITKVEQNPNDTSAKDKLAASTTKLTTMKIANPETIATIAKAQAALGEKDKAKSTVNKALSINPKLVPALDLKNRLDRQ